MATVFSRAPARRSRSACRLRKRGRVLLPRRIVVERERAAVQARLGDRARDLRRPPRSGRGRRSSGGPDAGPAADHAVRADRPCCRRCRRSRRSPCASPMRHVVADLDQVVELDAVADDGVAERAAVDAGVGADLDVVADARRGRAARSSPSGRRSGAKPKPSAPMTAPLWTMQRAPIEAAASTTLTRGPSRVARADAAPRPITRVRRRSSRRRRRSRRPRRPRTRRPHVGAERAPGRRPRCGSMPAPGARMRALGPPLRQPGEVQIRVGGDDRRAARSRGLARSAARRSRTPPASSPAAARSAGWRGRRSSLAAPLERLDARRSRRSGRRSARRRAAAMMSRSSTSPTVRDSYLPPWAFSALITLSVMSTRGPEKTASCRIRSYFSGLEDLLDDAVGPLDDGRQLLVLALVQVLLELAAAPLEVAVLVDEFALAPRRARPRPASARPCRACRRRP